MKASLRNISVKAELVQILFILVLKIKKGLFSAIVKDTVDGLMAIYLDSTGAEAR